MANLIGKKIKTISGRSSFKLLQLDDRMVKYENSRGKIYTFSRKRLDLVVKHWKKIQNSVNKESQIQALWQKHLKTGNTRDEIYCAAIVKRMMEL